MTNAPGRSRTIAFMKNAVGLCPACGRQAAIVYITPHEDVDFPADGLCECESCQEEWSVSLIAQAVVEFAPSSSIPVDWSPDWSARRDIELN
jgi:hypothetical protein